MLFLDSPIDVVIDSLSLGDKEISAPSYTPPTGYNFYGNLATSNNYRVYVRGIAGGTIYYTVTATTDATVTILIFPVLKKK